MDRKITKDIGTLKFTDLYPNGKGDVDENTRNFLLKVVEIMLDFISKTNDRKAKVLDFHQPDQLKQILDLEIPDEPLNLDQLLVDCKDTLKYQVKTGHPHFLNQLSTGLDIVCLAGEWLTATANTNMFTYEIAPCFILMEEVVLRKMREIIGWPEGDSMLAPGGSISNLYACLCARHKMFPDYKQKGLISLGQQLVIYTSEHSHYSLNGAGMVMGIGTEFVREVKCDKRGRMIPGELEQYIISDKAKGYTPFFVCATAGTTVLGAFDPINDIADICDKYGIWFHIDAAWGGGVLLSRKYRYKMSGVERAKSVTWNPHKLLGTLLQCSTCHFKEEGLLLSCNQLSADYLFQQDKHYDVQYDTGDKVIQCGRHNDVFKLWLQWRSKGDKGFEEHIDHLFKMTEYQVKQIKEKKDKYHLLFEPECTNVSFWYIPKRLRGVPHTPEKEKILGELTAKLKSKMMNAGTLMIGYQPLGDIPNFFRSIISSAAVQEADVDYALDELDRLGHDL
ncbi:glutamate decarboxylase [Parasteatoda tepidariorum]|uniref:glutamate decarboxylase n=1 Tax=Parasteatoda tepidariorum TaxID=114398 RepID=UPI00077FC875|nr:glutamate decarboxylase-like [Parasteatoda tepidariorum]